MPTISRQLRDWCRQRGFKLCREFVRELDDALIGQSDLDPNTLLQVCRRISTGFFRENDLDREAIAQELSHILEMPAVRILLVKHTPDHPNEPTPLSGEEEPPDVFLSYFHEDIDLVVRLACALAGQGYVVWYDKVGLSGGSSFPLTIYKALQETRYVVVIATAISVNRPWVEKEVAAALTREGEENNRKILIPLRIDDSPLPLWVRARQWCDFSDDFESGLRELEASLS